MDMLTTEQISATYNLIMNQSMFIQPRTIVPSSLEALAQEMINHTSVTINNHMDDNMWFVSSAATPHEDLEQYRHRQIEQMGRSARRSAERLAAMVFNGPSATEQPQSTEEISELETLRNEERLDPFAKYRVIIEEPEQESELQYLQRIALSDWRYVTTRLMGSIA